MVSSRDAMHVSDDDRIPIRSAHVHCAGPEACRSKTLPPQSHRLTNGLSPYQSHRAAEKGYPRYQSTARPYTYQWPFVSDVPSSSPLVKEPAFSNLVMSLDRSFVIFEMI